MIMNTLTKTERNREMGQSEGSYLVPPVDITEQKDEYLLEADMPGVGKEGLEVVLEGNELTIVGHRQRPTEGEVLLEESRPQDFRRTFVLDPVIDSSQIRAQIEHGTVTVHLPKADQVKPRRIKVD